MQISNRLLAAALTAGITTAATCAGFAQSTEQPSSGSATPAQTQPAAPAPDATVVIHEPHAVAVADIDGDGLDDIVTGERFWGHVPSGMPDFSEPARIYWFREERTAAGVVFTPTLIDDDSGVGTQLTVGDIDGDGKPDIVVSNKKGAFVFLQVSAH